MRAVFVAATAIAGLTLLSARADAGTVLTGQLDVNGGVIVTPGLIDWECNSPASVTCSTSPNVYGDENIVKTSTFTVGGTLVTSGLTAVLTKDLDQTLYPADGSFAPLDFFEQLNQFPTVNFQLRDIATCDELNAGGFNVTCAAGGTSPFGFSEATVGGITSTTVALILGGQVFDTADPLIYNWIGIYTAQFPGKSIADLIGTLTGGGAIDASFSAAKIVVATGVPEPATLLLLGTGLFGVGLRSRRRRANIA